MSGNGVDLGAIYLMLSQVAEAVTRHDRGLEALGRDMVEMRRELTEMRGTMATKGDLAELRQTITHYHSSVVGHGILISDLEARIRRVEEHLDLPAL